MFYPRSFHYADFVTLLRTTPTSTTRFVQWQQKTKTASKSIWKGGLWNSIWTSTQS